MSCFWQWRTEGGGLGCSTPPHPEITKFWQSCIWLQIERKMFSVPNSNILIILKIAEFRTPTPQDIQKKGSKILKLPRFAIVLR